MSESKGAGQANTIEAKIILLGDSAVGKTSILTRILKNTFDEELATTIGATYSYKTVQYQGKDVQMQIWDTAGQERYRCLAPIYYRGTNIVFLVYAVNSRTSFEVVDVWVKSLSDNNADPSLIYLIANKVDLERTSDSISMNEGMEKADAIKAIYYEVSAKTGNGIEDLLKAVAQTYVEKVANGVVATQKTKGANINEESKDSGCCA